MDFMHSTNGVEYLDSTETPSCTFVLVSKLKGFSVERHVAQIMSKERTWSPSPAHARFSGRMVIRIVRYNATARPQLVMFSNLPSIT